MKIAQNNGFTAITTKSKRVARNTVTGAPETDLLDNGVILIDNRQFEIVDNEIVSGYIDARGRPNKHITSVRLKDKLTQREFYFTNTHADFGKIDSLKKHQDQLDQEIDQVIVGDMNADSSKVTAALEDLSSPLKVSY